jgi:aromatic ring-opening dioxygenase LigB subunit
VDHPDQNISIKTGRQLLVDFNQRTKQYLKDEIIEEGESTQDVSVAALNANSKYGRVFFLDLGRTIPFRVDKNAVARTVPNLSRYLTQYVDNTGATVNIRFKKVLHVDGRLKRIIISDCYGIEGIA